MDSQRHLFDIPHSVTYLNCAYLSPSLLAVVDAGRQAATRQAKPWGIAAADFFDQAERLRHAFADLTGGDADGVALIPSASYGVGLAAANCDLRQGDAIVVLDEQFPSNVYPWRETAARAGASIVTVPRPGQHEWTPGVIEAIDERTAVVAVPNHHWTDGSKVDLAAVGAAARAAEAMLVVDATQSLGAAPLDLSAVQPDYLVASGYKWLLGPWGHAYVWVDPRHRLGTPIEYNWITRADAEDFTGLVDYKDEYLPGARRFDAGERADFILAPMAHAALSQILEWTVDGIAAHAAELTGRAERLATDMGLAPVPTSGRGAHLMGVRLPEGVSPDLPERLARSDVYVSIRGDSIRVSPHVYNDADDIDRLFQVIAEAA